LGYPLGARFFDSLYIIYADFSPPFFSDSALLGARGYGVLRGMVIRFFLDTPIDFASYKLHLFLTHIFLLSELILKLHFYCFTNMPYSIYFIVAFAAFS